METALLNYGGLGIMLIATLGLIKWGRARMEKFETAAEARHAACEARNVKLEDAIDVLRERQFVQINAFAEQGFAGLADATMAIRDLFVTLGKTPPPMRALRSVEATKLVGENVYPLTAARQKTPRP